MARRLWNIGILALIPIAWDLVALDAWIRRGYHLAGGLLIRLYVPLAMPRFSSELHFSKLPRITEPSLEIHRYQPHSPHLYFGPSPFLPHVSIAMLCALIGAWTIVEWLFVMGLLQWGAQLALASWSIRLRSLPVYLGINGVLIGVSSISQHRGDTLSVRLAVGLLVPLALLGLQYFFIFLKFELMTDDSNLIAQWRHSQAHRRMRTPSIVGWMVALVDIGLLSALIANLGSGALWSSIWVVIIDVLDVWLLTVLASNFKEATLRHPSTLPPDDRSSSKTARG